MAANGETKILATQTWRYPSREDCLLCHNQLTPGPLGLELRQLNGAFTYPGNKQANQLRSLDHIGMFSAPIGDPKTLDTLPDPFGEADLDSRARAYLHANCAQCHRGSDETHLCEKPLVSVMTEPDPTLRMPRAGGAIIDSAGVDLLAEWLQTNPSCP